MISSQPYRLARQPYAHPFRVAPVAKQVPCKSNRSIDRLYVWPSRKQCMYIILRSLYLLCARVFLFRYLSFKEIVNLLQGKMFCSDRLLRKTKHETMSAPNKDEFIIGYRVGRRLWTTSGLQPSEQASEQQNQEEFAEQSRTTAAYQRSEARATRTKVSLSGNQPQPCVQS